MSGRGARGGDATAPERAIVRGLVADARAGRVFWDCGPERGRLQMHALRAFVLAPAWRLARRALAAAAVFARLRAWRAASAASTEKSVSRLFN
jgi:hypothetical protein